MTGKGKRSLQTKSRLCNARKTRRIDNRKIAHDDVDEDEQSGEDIPTTTGNVLGEGAARDRGVRRKNLSRPAGSATIGKRCTPKGNEYGTSTRDTFSISSLHTNTKASSLQNLRQQCGSSIALVGQEPCPPKKQSSMRTLAKPSGCAPSQSTNSVPVRQGSSDGERDDGEIYGEGPSPTALGNRNDEVEEDIIEGDANRKEPAMERGSGCTDNHPSVHNDCVEDNGFVSPDDANDPNWHAEEIFEEGEDSVHAPSRNSDDDRLEKELGSTIPHAESSYCPDDCEEDNVSEDNEILVEEEGNNEFSNSESMEHVGEKRKYTYVKRNRRVTDDSAMRKRWRENMLALSNTSLKHYECCKKMMCFRRCNLTYLRSKMSTILQLSIPQRRQAIHDMLGSSGSFLFDGRKVCSTFLIHAFRFSRDLQSSVRESSRRTSQATNNSESKGDAVRSALHKDAVITFLERLADNTGDRMPDRREMHLPFFKRGEVYEHFKSDFTQLHNPNPPSSTYFFQVWNKFCAHVKVRKISRFAKCARCEQLRNALQEAVQKGMDTSSLKEQKRSHRLLIEMERREYKKKREQAMLHPDRYCSIIMDGADQSAFGLPHFMVKTKDVRGHSLKVKVVGVLDHGRPNRVTFLTMTEEQETGANHIIETLHRVLSMRAKRGSLPPELYIQLDNCTRENKNHFFLSYVEYLVAMGVFDRVEVGYLPVGHTHEDIDQVFSRSAERLRSNDAITLGDLHSELSSVYNDLTDVYHMKKIVNWSGLCHEAKCTANISNFSQYRYFLFLRKDGMHGRDEGRCVAECHVKVKCNDDWRALRTSRQGNGGFLTQIPDLQKTPPVHTKSLHNKAEVKKRLESEEGRINNMTKLADLHDLMDDVYNPRVDNFHWDLTDCLELSGKCGAVRTNNDQVGGTGEEEQDARDVERQTEEILRNDYTYVRNSYVAVKSEQDDTTFNFWIAKVESSRTSGEERVSEIEVHWMDTQEKENPFDGKYLLSYIDSKKKAKKRAHKEWIPVESVLCNFENLTKRGRLPHLVKRQLRDDGV